LTHTPDQNDAPYNNDCGRFGALTCCLVICLCGLVLASNAYGSAERSEHLPQNFARVSETEPQRSSDRVQEASIRFFTPVILAYLTACGGWLLLERSRLVLRSAIPFPATDRPWVDFLAAVVAALGIFALGSCFRAGLLLPSGAGWVHHLTWAMNNLIIFSPLALVLAFRRQGPKTILLSPRDVGRKVAAGVILGVVATAVFLVLRGELSRFGKVLVGVVDMDNATNFLPVMLEGVALAFLFVRIRWVFGPVVALLVPSVLFSVAHIPRQLANGLGPTEIIAFFVLNTLLPATILAVVVRSRDVIWLGIVHYIMDIAIRAFD